MRTSFTDSEDKLLVQIACQFEREGLRITWDYVARQMRTKRTPRQLRLRLASLKRTYGKLISGFPHCFFSGLTSRQLIRVPGPPPPLPQVSPQLAPPVRLATSLDATSSSCSVSVRAGISGDGSVTLHDCRGDASASNGNVAVFSADNTGLGASGIVGSHTGSTESGVSSLVYGGSSSPITGNMMVVSGSLTSVDAGCVDTRDESTTSATARGGLMSVLTDGMVNVLSGEHRCASGGIVGMAASNSTNNDVGGGGMLDRTFSGSSGVASGIALYDDMGSSGGMAGSVILLDSDASKAGIGGRVNTSYGTISLGSDTVCVETNARVVGVISTGGTSVGSDVLSDMPSGDVAVSSAASVARRSRQLGDNDCGAQESACEEHG